MDFAHPGRGCGHLLSWFCIFKRYSVPLHFLVNLWKKCPCPTEPTHCGQNRCPERGMSGAPQVHIDQVVDGSLHLGWEDASKGSNWKKSLEGGQRLVEGASLGLFHPNSVGARNRSAGPPGVLPSYQFLSAIFKFLKFVWDLNLCLWVSLSCQSFGFDIKVLLSSWIKLFF